MHYVSKDEIDELANPILAQIKNNRKETKVPIGKECEGDANNTHFIC